MAKDNKKEVDEHSGVEITGHEWDGIKELNNPSPRWWVWVWIVTVIFSIGYWVLYPAWPTIEGNTKGILGWTQYNKLASEQEELMARKASSLKALKGKSLESIQQDKGLYEFALKGGSAVFKDNCASCHGTGAEGHGSFPNLNDDDWLWGGSLDDIYTTISHGIRSIADDDTRDSQMPAFGKDEILTREEINQVADYVLGLSKGSNSDDMPGKQIFADNCAACHGDNGEGGRDFGAPNLSDSIWLKVDGKKDIINMIHNPKMGIMPNWGARFDDETIKMLTIYVHSLGGGE